MTRTALIAGAGDLPVHLARALDATGGEWCLAELEGTPSVVPDHTPIRFRLERLVPFLEHLADQGVTRVTFAGGIRRPQLEPELFDARTATLVPRFLAAIRSGDDGALRTVIDIFEEWGFAVAGADEIAPGLVPGAGLLAGALSSGDEADAAFAARIVGALGALDVGQGAVVAQELCIALETLPGTDAMLRFVADHVARLRPDPSGARGLLYKAPKPGQDRRIDLPTIGSDTLRLAHQAGLGGIAWQAGSTLLLDRDAMIDEAGRLGLFLWSRTP